MEFIFTLIDLIITIVAYLSYPFFYLVLYKNKTYNHKDAVRISTINSVVVGLGFIFLRALLGSLIGKNEIVISSAPVIYGFINYGLLFKGNSTNIDLNKVKPTTIHKQYCIHCGKQIDSDSTFCCYCGKEQKIETKPTASGDFTKSENPWKI